MGFPSSHQKESSERRRRTSLEILESDCRLWNSKYPVGTEVEYHPVIGYPDFRLTRTRSEAYVLSGHTAVLFVENESGCVAIAAIKPVKGQGLNRVVDKVLAYHPKPKKSKKVKRARRMRS